MDPDYDATSAWTKKSPECCGYWQGNPPPSRHKRRREGGWEKLIDKGTLQPSKQDGGKSILGQGAPSTRARKHHTPEGPGDLQQLLVDGVWGSQAAMLERRRPWRHALLATLRQLDFIPKQRAVSHANHMVMPSNTPCVSRHILPWTNWKLAFV